MRTYNATPARLRALANAIEAGVIEQEDARIKADSPAERIIYEADDQTTPDYDETLARCIRRYGKDSPEVRRLRASLIELEAAKED